MMGRATATKTELYFREPAKGTTGERIISSENVSSHHARRSDGSLDREWPRRTLRLIQEFPNEPYAPTIPIQVSIVQHTLEDFTASSPALNIAMPGQSIEDAVQNLAVHILDVYETLNSYPPEELAEGPRKQLATLKDILQKR